MRSFRYVGIALAVAMLAGLVQAETFDIVFQVKVPKGLCQVRTPGSTEFVPAIRNKAYPYGTTIQTVGPESSAVLLITKCDTLRIMPNTEVTLSKEESTISTNCAKIAKLSHGTLSTRLSSSATNSPVYVDSDLGRCKDIFGICKMTVRKGENKSSLMVRAESNSQLKFIAPQIIVPLLRNGYSFSIKSMNDKSFTRIGNLFGEYPVFINTSLELDPEIPEEAEESGSEFLFPIKTTSKAKINLWRENAPVGDNLIVSVLATDSEGKGKQSFAFAVGDPSITSRSQVAADKASSKEGSENDELAMDAAGEDPLAAFAEEPIEETPADTMEEDGFSDFEDTDSMDEYLF